jgi:hypothetical protein
MGYLPNAHAPDSATNGKLDQSSVRNDAIIASVETAYSRLQRSFRDQFVATQQRGYIPFLPSLPSTRSGSDTEAAQYS